MPIRDFQCTQCKHTKECIVRITDPVTDEKCPKCKGELALLSSIGLTYFVLKGRGWASTGYSKD